MERESHVTRPSHAGNQEEKKNHKKKPQVSEDSLTYAKDPEGFFFFLSFFLVFRFVV